MVRYTHRCGYIDMEHKYIDISKESKHLFKGFLQNNYFLNYNITMDTGHCTLYASDIDDVRA